MPCTHHKNNGPSFVRWALSFDESASLVINHASSEPRKHHEIEGFFRTTNVFCGDTTIVVSRG
jgi:hypothetical protein